MKKIITLIGTIGLIVFSANTVMAKNNISDKIENMMMINYPEVIEKANANIEEFINTSIEEQYEYLKSIHQASRIEQVEDSIRNGRVLIPEKTFCYYLMSAEKYLKQYSDTNNIDYLIDDTKYWYPIYVSNYTNRYSIYDETGKYTEWGKDIADDKTIEFLLDPEEIERIVESGTDENIIDAKIISIPLTTILYLKGEQTDYGIIIYDWHGHEDDEVYLERYKLYKMSDILNSCGLYETLPIPEILETKPTYEAEAQELLEAGILKGTDKGLELLKPLSRIEATTILVRILGFENEPTSDVSYFADIPSDNWGAKYANIAADKNIAAGVGDGLFAPNDTITASQFATMVLRAGNHAEFNWEDAINIMIDEEIITLENAETMDLFTRGDMAKIIYEARGRNLF